MKVGPQQKNLVYIFLLFVLHYTRYICEFIKRSETLAYRIRHSYQNRNNATHIYGVNRPLIDTSIKVT